MPKTTSIWTCILNVIIYYFFIINNKTSSKNNQKSTMNPSTQEVYEGYSKRSIKKMHGKYNYQVTQTKKQKHPKNLSIQNSSYTCIVWKF